MFGINSHNLRKTVSVASVIYMLQAFRGKGGGESWFFISFPEGAILMIIVSMKCLLHCEDMQGHVLVTFKRLKLPSASHCTVTGEEWKTLESKQVICGAWNHPSDTWFTPLQVQAGYTSKQGASAAHPHLGWRIQAAVQEQLILKAVLWPEADIMLCLSMLWL